MFGEARVEDWVAVGFCGAVFKGTREGGEEVGRFVEEGFGALGDELWRGRGGVGQDCGEGDDGFRGGGCGEGVWGRHGGR